MDKKTVVVIGAGPAGLTASLELLRQRDLRVIVLEASSSIGGISKTVPYKGYRIDIGGHRFFSKSAWVMNWWQEILPVQNDKDPSLDSISLAELPDTDKFASNKLKVMLVRQRLSRIFFRGQFYDYPLKACLTTALKLGPFKAILMLTSYIYAKLRPIKSEKSLEDFIINRFGRKLYLTFFKDYTEKVWGVPCRVISPSWGAQRIKSLSIGKVILHALKTPFIKGNSALSSKNSQTSLIDSFLYPKHGPGQMWETVAEKVMDLGGTIKPENKAIKLQVTGNSVKKVFTRDILNQVEHEISADYVISTMPVTDLINAISPQPPNEVVQVARSLQYRDFITVGLLLKRLKKTKGSLDGSTTNLVPDNWIYIQDKEVKVGRLQVFNNWSPYMIADPSKVWIGLEYFCQEGDYFWKMPDSDLIHYGVEELAKIGLANQNDLIDGVVIRTPKAYPCYFGSYDQFDVIRNFVNTIDNLFLIGRNGMHRYNNQDHSMLTARYAADAIIKGSKDKKAIWDVNIDDDYHEE
jgi:protoporphyrinogen oxidase